MCKKQNMCSNDMIHFYIYGPIFIVSHDLYIASDVNNNSNFYSNLGFAYELPPGQTINVVVVSRDFKVSEIELSQII